MSTKIEWTEVTWNPVTGCTPVSPACEPEDEREADIIAELTTGWLVVLDDLDKQNNTDWERETLYTFLNQRYVGLLPTVLTLNTALDAPDPLAPGRLALERVMGRAVLDRIYEVCWGVVEFDAPSYRSGMLWEEPHAV